MLKKIIHVRGCFHFFSFLLFWSMMGCIFSAATFAGQLDMTFQSAVNPEPCDVALSGDAPGSGILTFPNITPDQLGVSKSSPSKVIYIELTGCSSAEAYAPTITVSGTTVNPTQPTQTVSHTVTDYLYNTNNPDGNDPNLAARVGFIIGFDLNTVDYKSMNVSAACNVISKTVNGCSAKMPDKWLGEKIPVAVAVSQGGFDNYQTGQLSANVTFLFSYA